MKKLALVGKDIAHSRSQEMYEKILEEKVEYQLLDYPNDKDIEPLKEIFDKNDINGLSVTAPYKKHFFNETIVTDEDVWKITLINCIGRKGNEFYATNTDLLACRKILKNYFEMGFENYILFGDGAMAQMTHLIFKNNGKSLNQFSRKEHGDLTYLDLSYLEGKSLFINATSRSFIFKGILPESSTFLDYNYSNSEQKDQLIGKAEYMDGLELLELQAKHALEFWSSLGSINY